MSKSNAFETSLLTLLFNNTNIANLGDATGVRGSTTAGSLYLSLHTADPGETAAATEAAYGGYARQAVARSSAGFTISGNSVTLAAAVSFPACTSGSETELFFGIWTAVTAGTLLYSGPLGSLLSSFTAAASTDTFTLPGLSGVSVGDRIAFFARPGDTLPTGVTEGTAYFVKTVSGASVTISTTSGGSTLDVTGDGEGVAMRLTPVVVSTGVTPQLTTGLTITED